MISIAQNIDSLLVEVYEKDQSIRKVFQNIIVNSPIDQNLLEGFSLKEKNLPLAEFQAEFVAEMAVRKSFVFLFFES